jgi:hypothetical protein
MTKSKRYNFFDSLSLSIFTDFFFNNLRGLSAVVNLNPV